MKKYKIGRKLTKVSCDCCGKIHTKPTSEYKRNKKLNRNNYCSRKCAGKSVNNLNHLKKVRNNGMYDISQHSDNQKDEYSPFRTYIRNVKRRFKTINIDVQYLKKQWEIQQGICPYTGFKLILKTYNKTQKIPYHLQASLDRIDNSKGYVKGNVEFVSLPINYFKADKLSKKETLVILQEIKLNFH